MASVVGCCAACAGCASLCTCFANCCKTSSTCGMKFNRIVYTLFLLIPFICNIIFLYHPEYFDNSFINNLICYKNNTIEKQGKIYDPVWIMNIRFIFTYFVLHCALLVFSLFALIPSTTPIGKVAHRGLVFIKLILLIALFFISFAYPNKSMENFQYLMVFLAIVYQMVLIVMVTNLSYRTIGPVTNSNICFRILFLILEVVLYGLAVTMYVYVYLYDTSTKTLAISIIVIVLNVLAFILSIVSKQHSTVAVALPTFISAMILSYIIFVQYNTNIINVFDQIPHGLFYAYAVVAMVISIFELVASNTTEVTLRPMFAGMDPEGKPEFGSYVSTLEDEDMSSSASSYYYWVFHLTVIGCLCYMGVFTCYPQSTTMINMEWYGFGVTTILGFLIILWTELAQMVCKDRVFY